MNAPVEIGDVLAGKYRIERVLGAGGMGVVVAATHLRLDQLVAIKFLLPSALESTEVVERFAREARAASKIQSEHVARVIDVGELASGSPYMVMEYLEGSDLSDILQAEARLPIARAVDYLLEACEALAEAHAAGIVHRDLKPANLFLANRADGVGIIKVLDFGISKASADPGVAAARLTGTAVIMGSPLYMSPEQLRSSRDVDARSDLWALGVIFFELITGQTPFVGETVTEIIANIMTEDAPLASSLRDDVPPGLDAVVSLCLAKKRDKRYESVADLATELAPFGTAAARQSAELICRVLRVSLSARESLGTTTPTARLSGMETIREPAADLRVGVATDAPVSVGARTAVDQDRPPSDEALAQARAFGGDTAMSPTSLQGKRVDPADAEPAVSSKQDRWRKTPPAEPTPPAAPVAKPGLPPVAWAIGAVALLGFGAVAVSRGGATPGGPTAAISAVGGATLAPSAASVASASAQSPPPTASTPTISPADPPSAASAASSAAAVRPGPRPAPSAGAKPGVVVASTAATTATTVATAATAPPPPATTTAPASVNPLDKLNKVR